MRHILMAAGLLLAALTLPALADEKKDSPVSNEVRNIPELPQACSSSPFGDVCLHTFGGVKTRIPLPDTKGFSCGEIEAQLFQLSSRLAMPAGDKVALQGDHCPEATIFLPAVKEKTIFRVRFTVAGSASAQNPDMMMQNTLVAVYPDDLWAPLREWSESNNLIVSDRGSKLIPLLEKLKIRYSPIVLPDQGEHVRQVCIWVPVSDSDAGAPFSCSPVLVLHEKTESLPMIHTLEAPDNYRVDVFMPLLPALADHPLVQKTFIDLIQSTLRGD